MGYNFPNSPAVNQTFTPSGGPTFQWNGVAWNAVTQGMPVTVYMSDTAPTSPAPGQLWWNSTTGNLSVFYADADSTQWVQVSGNLSSTAPNDGGEYVMRNGVWRLKAQTYDVAGKAQQDITVPAWNPTQVRLTYSIFAPSNMYLSMRMSSDGATFPAGATDYTYVGFAQYTGTTGFSNVVTVNATFCLLSLTGDNLNIPHAGTTHIKLTRPTTSQVFEYRVHATSYANGTAYLNGTWLGGGWAGTATHPSTSLKALRIMNSGGVIWPSGKVVAEWLE